MRLRSLLFVPGDRPDRFQKALDSSADALILDLEDAVADARKHDARAKVSDFLSGYKGKTIIFVRINALGSGHTQADLAASRGAAGIVLPKAEGGGSLAELDRLLVGEPAAILPIATETPKAIFALGTYGGVTERLAGLTWGAEDLPAAIGATSSRHEDGSYTAPYETVRALALFGSHAAGVPAIETVYPDLRNSNGLKTYLGRAVRDGFSGMLAIHPSQIAAINEAFTPTTAAIAAARSLIAAFEAAGNAGVIQFQGMMVDAPHLKQARRLLIAAGISD